jgi:hypothetical protein
MGSVRDNCFFCYLCMISRHQKVKETHHIFVCAYSKKSMDRINVFESKYKESYSPNAISHVGLKLNNDLQIMLVIWTYIRLGLPCRLNVSVLCPACEYIFFPKRLASAVFVRHSSFIYDCPFIEVLSLIIQ